MNFKRDGRDMHDWPMDDSVLQLVVDVREKIIAIAEKHNEEPYNVLMWYIGKTMHAGSDGVETQGYQVAHDCGIALGEHFRAVREGRSVDMTPGGRYHA